MQVYANIFPQGVESQIHEPGGLSRASVTNQGWLLLWDKVSDSICEQADTFKVSSSQC